VKLVQNGVKSKPVLLTMTNIDGGVWNCGAIKELAKRQFSVELKGLSAHRLVVLDFGGIALGQN